MTIYKNFVLKKLYEENYQCRCLLTVYSYSFGLGVPTLVDGHKNSSIQPSADFRHQLLPDGARVGKVIVPEPGGVSFDKDVRANNFYASDWQVSRNPALSLVEIEPE